MKKKHKVLIVDHGSKYIKKLEKMYVDHPDIKYDVDVIKSDDVLGMKLKGYNIIHLSGSRVKKNFHDQVNQYVLDNAHPDTHVIGTCYGAEGIAAHHGAEVKRLKKYQKGKQEIKYKGKKAHMHKSHRWGIPVKGSKLEAIATSEQVFDDGSKGMIHEMFKVKGKKHYGVQGHGEAGAGKKIMYELLSEIGGYKK